MPSEAQSQEPRDSGLTPPVTRAKAAATSPTPERRCRGRPRKDGRSVPSTPPPPPPPSKSRKKGRGRGQAQVEDEENMDAKEKKTPQKTGENPTQTLNQARNLTRTPLIVTPQSQSPAQSQLLVLRRRTEPVLLPRSPPPAQDQLPFLGKNLQSTDPDLLLILWRRT
ncbi:uncharacterized protein [Cebidichthys violaceus]|uniref:uncharacterized protein n=1 Tax=Cebidichthys violaceus TaxID=271503 RepID=UPI0035CA0E73